MSIHVWILNHYATAPGSSGGTRHYDLARELVQRGYRVTICASSFEHITRKEKKTYGSRNYIEEEYNGIRFIWLKTTPYYRNDWRRVLNILNYTSRAFRTLRRNQDKPDVVIGSLMHPLAAWVGYWLARKYRCKFYFEERDLWPQTLIDLGRMSRYNPAVWLLGQLERFLYRHADRTVVLFDKAVDYVAGKGVNPRKIVHVPNGVDLQQHDLNAENLPEEYRALFAKLDGKFIAVYAGSHGMANHLDAVLDSARITRESNPRIHYLLIGDGQEKARLLQRQKNEGLDNVIFMPPVNKECIPAILRQVDVGLLPLMDSPVFRWGISPNKLYDYMAAALPVILLCNVDGTDIERSGGGCVIRHNFSENMALTLSHFAENDRMVQQLGLSSRAYVERYHAWPVLSEKIVQVLHEDLQLDDGTDVQLRMQADWRSV
jgi:glycosyltransferase involved in cell wall biosynthesis